MDTDRAAATVLAAELLVSNVLGILSSLEYKTPQTKPSGIRFFRPGLAPYNYNYCEAYPTNAVSHPVKNISVTQEGFPGFVTNDDDLFIGRFCRFSIFYGRVATGDS